MFWLFGLEAFEPSGPWPGMEPTPPALEGDVLLTTGPPAVSRMKFLLVTTLPLMLCLFLALGFRACADSFRPVSHDYGLCSCCLVAQSCPTLPDPMDCSPPGSSVRGILQARILEQVAAPSSRGSSWPRDRSWVSRIGRRILYHWAPREALTMWLYPHSTLDLRLFCLVRSIWRWSLPYSRVVCWLRSTFHCLWSLAVFQGGRSWPIKLWYFWMEGILRG